MVNSTSNPDESPRPPTFVQIHPPARPGMAYRMLGAVGAGIAVVAGMGWGAYRMAADQAVAPVAAQIAMQDASSVIEALPPQPAPADLESELAKLTIDAAVSAPAWHRQSLMESMSPFDASAPDRQASSGASPPADAHDATQAGSYEVSVRLDKGDTIGGALQKLGFEAEAIADAVAALKPHVRLKRLPVGQGLTLQIRPPETENDKPILQALTLQPEGHRTVKAVRDEQGEYVVEVTGRPMAR
jgi:hypothetical protein